MTMDSVRLDKWLWAARFYKTRSVAKQAVESGRVHLEHSRVKVSKEVRVGMVLQIRQGSATKLDEKEVRILKLSDQRGPAQVAQALYEETQESVERRAAVKAGMKAQVKFDHHKPSKKQRRQHAHWLEDQEF